MPFFMATIEGKSSDGHLKAEKVDTVSAGEL